MKRILIGLGIVIGLVVVVALIAPLFIDVNQYKPMIEEQAEKATGRKLTLEGDLSLSLLPSPTVSVENVKLANDPRSKDPEMLDVGRASVSVSWFPLPYISGKVNVSNVELEDTTIIFEQYADGSNNAPTPQTDVSDDDFLSDDAPDATAEPTEAETAEAAPLDVSIGSLSLNNINLVYRDQAAASEERVTLDDVDISLGGLMGPFHGDGKIATRGLAVGFEMNVGKLEEERSLPVSLTILEESSDSKIGISLAVLDAMSDPRVNGTLKVESDDLGGLAAFASGAEPASDRKKVPFLLESPLKASTSGVDLSEIAIRLGDESFDGAISATLGDQTAFDVNLKSSTVDLDRLLAAVEGITSGMPAAEAKPAQAAEAKTEEAAPFEIPADLKGKVALGIGALTYQGDAVQDVAFVMELDKGVARITKAGAKLPASTTASLNGSLRASNGAPLFTGTANLSTPDLRGLLTFAGVDVSTVPDGKLKVFRANLPITATDSSVKLNGMSVNFDGSTLSGSLAAGLGAIPKVSADLALDRINVDDYQGGEAAPAETKADAKSESSGGTGGGASPFEADIALRVGTLTMSGTTLQNARVAAQVEGAADGSSTINVDGTLGSTKLKADGRIGDMADPIKALTLNAKISNPSARAFAAPFAGMLQGPPRFVDGPLSYTVALVGKGSTLNADFEAKSNVGALTVKGDVTDPMSDAPKLDMTVAADASEFSTFFSSLALPYDPAGRRMGALTLRATASGSPTDVKLNLTTFKIGDAEVTGSVSASNLDDHPKIKADFKAGEVDLDKLMPRGEGGNEPTAQAQADATERAPGTPPYTDEPIDLSGLRGVDADVTMQAKYLKGQGLDFKDADLVFSLKGGVAHLSKLTGKLYDGPVDMTLKLDGSTDVPALDVKYSLEQANFETASMALMNDDFITGTLSSKADVTGKGRTDRELAASLNGFIYMFGERGKIKGFDLEALAKALGQLGKGNFQGVRDAMSSGETEYKSLTVKFDIKDGVMTSNDAVVEVFSGKITGKSRVDLPQWNQNSRVEARVATKDDVPPVALIFSGPVDAPQRQIDLASLTKYYATSGIKNLLGGGKKDGEEGGEQSPGAGIQQLFGGGKKKEDAPAEGGEAAPAEGGEAAPAEEKKDPAAAMQQFFGGGKKKSEPAKEPAPAPAPAEEPVKQEPAPAEKPASAEEPKAEPEAAPAEAPAEEPKAEEKKEDPAEAIKKLFGN